MFAQESVGGSRKDEIQWPVMKNSISVTVQFRTDQLHFSSQLYNNFTQNFNFSSQIILLIISVLNCITSGQNNLT